MVTLVAIVEGDVSEFDRASFVLNLATFLGIDSAQIVLVVAPASVRVTVTISPPADRTADSITAALAPLQTNAADARAALGVTAQVASVQVVLLEALPPPSTPLLSSPPLSSPPLSSPPADDAGGMSAGGMSAGVLGAIIGGAVGGVVLVGLVILLICYRRRKTARHAAYDTSLPGMFGVGHGRLATRRNAPGPKRAEDDGTTVSILTGHQQRYEISEGGTKNGPFVFYPSELSSRSAAADELDSTAPPDPTTLRTVHEDLKDDGQSYTSTVVGAMLPSVAPSPHSAPAVSTFV